jgi:hypothetical protein
MADIIICRCLKFSIYSSWNADYFMKKWKISFKKKLELFHINEFSVKSLPSVLIWNVTTHIYYTFLKLLSRYIVSLTSADFVQSMWLKYTRVCYHCSRKDDRRGTRVCDDNDHDDDLRTVTTNSHTVHPPGDIRAWTTMVEWCPQANLLIRPPQFSGNPTSKVI